MAPGVHCAVLWEGGGACSFEGLQEGRNLAAQEFTAIGTAPGGAIPSSLAWHILCNGGLAVSRDAHPRGAWIHATRDRPCRPRGAPRHRFGLGLTVS